MAGTKEAGWLLGAEKAVGPADTVRMGPQIVSESMPEMRECNFIFRYPSSRSLG